MYSRFYIWNQQFTSELTIVTQICEAPRPNLIQGKKADRISVLNFREGSERVLVHLRPNYACLTWPLGPSLISAGAHFSFTLVSPDDSQLLLEAQSMFLPQHPFQKYSLPRYPHGLLSRFVQALFNYQLPIEDYVTDQCKTLIPSILCLCHSLYFFSRALLSIRQ